MIIHDLYESPQLCPECGGISFSDLILAEKKDACYYKVKASAKVWPSAYASGRLVQCRKKGADNYGNKSEGVMEMDKSQTPPGRDGSNDSNAGKKEYTAKATTPEKVAKHGEKILNKELNKKQGVAEGSLNEFAPGDGGDSGEEDTLHKYARMWYNGDDAVQQQVEQALARQGWEIGEIESEEGGAFVVRSGDEHGDSYIGFGVTDLTEGWKSALGSAALAGAMALGAGGANARVTPDGQGGFTGGLKPSATVTAPADNKPAAEAPKGFSKEYLQSVVDGKHPRPMVSVEKAKELLKNMQEGMAEGMERAVDAKGRTQAQWAQLVMSKFPGAKITQAKMIDGPMQATLPDGRKIGWSKVEQIDEIFNPSSMLAIFMRAASRFVSDFLPIGIGAISTYAATTALIGPFAAAAASTAVGNQLFQTLQNQQNKVPGVIQMMVEKYFGSEAEKVEFMILHAKNAYQGKSEFRWRGEQWPVTLQKDEAEAIIEKNDKYWLDAEKQKEIDAEKAKIDAGKTDMDFAKEQGMAEDQVNEKSVSQAQFRTMAAAAHNPKFAKKVGISQDVAREFNKADKGSNYKKLPARTTEGEVEKTKTGIIHRSSGAYGGGEAPRAPYDPGKYAKDIDHLDKDLTSKLDKSMGIKWPHGNKQSGMDEGEQQKGADYRDPPEADYGDDYQDMVARVKKLAGLGPLKTVYDPAKRVYRNMPTAVQPKK
jgi:hypothetical protein